MAKQTRKRRIVLTPEQRREIVRKVEDYSATHEVTLRQAMEATGITSVNYYRCREMTKGQSDEVSPPQEFPLAIIPERRPLGRPKKTVAWARTLTNGDDDKQIVAQLLEIAAKLLRR